MRLAFAFIAVFLSSTQVVESDTFAGDNWGVNCDGPIGSLTTIEDGTLRLNGDANPCVMSRPTKVLNMTATLYDTNCENGGAHFRGPRILISPWIRDGGSDKDIVLLFGEIPLLLAHCPEK